MSAISSLRVNSLLAAYRSEALRPSQVIEEVYERIAAAGTNPIWILRVNRTDALSRARTLEADPSARALPLYGVPFAIKDNIDVEGLPTTAGCPKFAYAAKQTAAVVARLLNAGAILIGKTNLDQFATGLVGTRSPYGPCSSVFDERYISGGSSAGSAVAVAQGLVSFSLGTDTAGSGRVPAAFNNVIGLKPTRGLLSARGVVPACRSLDCVSIFTLDAADADAVFDVARGYDSADPYSRPWREAAAPWLASQVRVGVPAPSQLEFFGDGEASKLFARAVKNLPELNAELVEIDYAPFRAAAELLYQGPWVAERLAAIGPFLEQHADDAHPVVSQIIQGGARYTAADAFRAAYRLAELEKEAAREWAKMDVLLLPTTGTIYTHEAVAADPVALNTNLGYYTNFVNMLDLCAVAVPAGFRDNHLPFGVTFIGPALHDRAVLALAGRFHGAQGLTLGATQERPMNSPEVGGALPGCVELAVVGAHLSGQPLNAELTSRRARLLRTCRTGPEYRFYALKDTAPAKPGLIREPGFEGPGIEVEVWAMPTSEFGSFVEAIPPPLGIGSLALEDGSSVKGFVCEGCAAGGSLEITAFGGWRKWLASRKG